MIVEHQPQNVITTLSVRLAAQYAQHVESCKGWGNWRVLCVCIVDASALFSIPLLFRDSDFFPQSFLVLLFKCPICCVHAKPIAFSMGFLLAVFSIFSCWCFNGSSVYLPNPFGKHKTNILNTHTQYGIIASFKTLVGWTKCNSIWHETSSRVIEIVDDFFTSPRFWSGTNMAIIIRATCVWVVKRAPRTYETICCVHELCFSIKDKMFSIMIESATNVWPLHPSTIYTHFTVSALFW